MIGMVKWSDKTKRLESDVISWAMPKGKIFQHSKQNHMMTFDRFLARSIPLKFTVSVFDSFCWYCPFCDGISPTKKNILTTWGTWDEFMDLQSEGSTPVNLKDSDHEAAWGYQATRYPLFYISPWTLQFFAILLFRPEHVFDHLTCTSFFKMVFYLGILSMHPTANHPKKCPTKDMSNHNTQPNTIHQQLTDYVTQWYFVPETAPQCAFQSPQ